MNFNRKTALRLEIAALPLALASLAPSAAQAQEAAAECADANANSICDADEGTAIIVTGTRLARPALESPVPITSVGGDDFLKQGQTNIGDTLNDLPQLRSTFAQQNPGAGVGIAGLSLLDLRGLGTVRTLVLVNGRRHVAADILNNASSPDVNTIPNDLIERVDIVTGGNSAVYGSDAIAGVVNFILRKNFEGIQLRASGGMSEKGFGKNAYASAMFGRNFADGRGNVTLHGEFAHQDRIYASDIPWYRQVDGFVTSDVDSGGLANASDGFPDAIFARDIRSATIHRYGMAFVPQSQSIGACGYGTLANNGPANTSGTAFHCNYIFNADGAMTAQTGTRFGSGPAGTITGGNGQTSREGTQLSILPNTRRMSFNLLGHYEFSEAAEAFVEAKWVRVNAVGNQLGPTFLNNSTASLGNDARIDPRLDNPFLSAADRTTLANAILASNCGFNLGSSVAATTCRTLTATEKTNIANGSYRFLFSRNLTDSEDRDERFQRDTWRVVGGLRGTFNTDWKYEVSANYGKFKETTDMRGFVNRQRFLLSLDAGLNTATGKIECRSKFDPAAAVGAPGYADSAATLAADIAACVPYNVFGGKDNSAAVNYFKQQIINRSSIDQLEFQGFVSGNLGQLFELPGGPVKFVLGGDWRRERAFNDSDAAADNGISNSVFLGDVALTNTQVKEAFGEIEIPLLKDMPLFHDLTISGAGRVSDYNTGAGTVWTYNGGVEWSPFADLRLRANYGRAVRAPNVTESGFPNVPNFSNGFVDPCNPNAIGANAIRTANCQSTLSAAQIANLQTAGYSLGIISGSNPNLLSEKSDSYTIGGVFTPSFVPGLSITVDFYRINVKNVIATLGAQTIVNVCYDTPGLATPLCNAFQRNLSGSNGPKGELPGQILNNTLVAGPQNFARRIRKGIDVEASYRTTLGSDIRMSTRMIYSHQIQNSNFESATLPTFENRILSELGDPQDEFRWTVDFDKGPLSLGYTMRYIGPQLTTTYENLNPLNGSVGGLNLDAFETTKYPSVMYHNLRFEYEINGEGSGPKFNLYGGVDNVTNVLPPLGTTATGVGSAIFNIRGRNYYLGFKANF